MAVAIARERWTGRVSELVLGKDPNTVRAGGETTLPFLFFEGSMPNYPLCAMEIWDMAPGDWPQMLKEPFLDVMDDPAAWARKNVEYGADLICLKLASAHPDAGNAAAEDCARTASEVAGAVDVPLIVIGPGVEEKDVEVLPAVAEALEGRHALLGCATLNNYKTITAACMVHGHSIIASSPLDINLAKQLNILITEMGLGAGRIAMDPLVGALGYGMEYAYSIIERMRMSALTGDRMMAMPVISFAGQEAWKAKEARVSTEEVPEWGDQGLRAILWEFITSVALLQSGGGIFVLRHPEAVARFKDHAGSLMRQQEKHI